MDMSEKALKILIESTVAEVLSESSLSRAWQHIQEHDCALISAMRYDPMDLSQCVNKPDTVLEDQELEFNKLEKSPKELNKIRTRNLKSSLLYLGYGVSAVRGSFIENFGTSAAVEVAEESFFVVNIKNDSNFKNNIEFLGQKFCQDSVLIIPKGGKGAYVLGTNKTSDPGLGNKKLIGDLSFGKESQFMTRIGKSKRPFTFSESLDVFSKYGWAGKLGITQSAKRTLNK